MRGRIRRRVGARWVRCGCVSSACWREVDLVRRCCGPGPSCTNLWTRSTPLLVVVPLIFGRGFILAPGPSPGTMPSRGLGGTIGGPGPPLGIKPGPKMAWTWSKQGSGANKGCRVPIFGGSARGCRPLPRLTACRHCHLAARPARRYLRPRPNNSALLGKLPLSCSASCSIITCPCGCGAAQIHSGVGCRA